MAAMEAVSAPDYGIGFVAYSDVYDDHDEGLDMEYDEEPGESVWL